MHLPLALQTAAGSGPADILAVANNPVLWICVAGVFAVIIIQSAIFLKAARRAAPAVEMSPADIRTSFRSGAVSAIGPSLAVSLVAVALLGLFGAPAVLSRIGLIGSAAYDVSAAGIAAGSMGAKLGDATYTQSVFAVAFFAMSIGGAMWMLATLILTPVLRRGDAKIRSINPLAMAIVPAAALIGAFACLGLSELPKSGIHVLSFLVSGAVMGLCLLLARKLRKSWLREWGLGFAIVSALGAAFIAVGPAVGA
ncbi:uncharacterized protein DUF5058 [Arthrobacter sp. SLBN-112]|jgi:hypothetical protein|uniref:DUF5058 family protein n=1 Tax=Arthrobacter sp. SLBN-112 TaxID=2768452 RepID=UPI0011506A8E|nr:DUF5058 family protein [Arthrobacter sp. SLBN-112]TQJ39153.1 uncharacterized protein DUF5058 [Arthrobacter sp. SLBN-112]